MKTIAQQAIVIGASMGGLLAAVEQTVEKLGGIDILVNNAGVANCKHQPSKPRILSNEWIH